MNGLTPEKALIFRITHVANVPWILANGLHCSNSNLSDPNYVQIGNVDIIARRTQRNVPVAPGGTLSDYIPFYFTPFSPMLLNIKTGFNGVTQRPMEEIAILVSSLREAQERGIGFVFTDRHAYLQAAEFYNDLERLDRIAWPILQARNFKRDPDDPGKFERYQAEALIYRHLPIDAILGVVCYGAQQQEHVQQNCDNLGLPMKALCKPSWYL
jgi:ssDNA thymidine ADP-ribosyltransferase DarT-like protein